MTLAQALGVSRSTVSNAYNHPDQLSAATPRGVFAMARELGYAGPDPRAATCAAAWSGPSG